MRRTVFAVSLTAILLITVIGILSIRGAQATNVRLNVKDLRQHGLTIIAPTDPAFNGRMTAYLSGMNDEQKRIVEVLKPFSVFIKNSGKADIIGYTLKWELVRTDGRVVTAFSSYIQPGLLMGEGVPSDKVNSDNVGRRIRRNSLIFASWDTSIGQATSGGGAGTLPPDTDVNQIRESLQNRNEEALINSVSKQLQQATSITVSIDGAFFEDGTFIGPDSSGFFDQVRAQVEAKEDIISDIQVRLGRGESPDQILKHLESAGSVFAAMNTNLGGDNTYAQHYNYWSKLYFEEILRIKKSVGDSKQALAYIIRPSGKAWPMLYKQKD
jgi:hypothetical protein